MEPTPEQVERGAGVLAYFVNPWNLPLNPEELAELAYAVLVHHDSTASWEEIGAAVEEQIAEHQRQAEALDAAYGDDPGAPA
jgi:hypothetical protein